MGKIKRITAILLLVSSICSVIHADSYTNDELTEYQKERLTLVNTAFNSIVEGMTQTELFAWGYMLSKWLEENESIYKLNENDPLGRVELMEAYLEETCGIVPWMIGSDNNTILEEFQYRKYNSICRRYQEERKALDEKSSASVLAEEFQIQKRRGVIRTRIIERVVSKEFAEWNKKDEYEKTANYEKRLQERSEWVLDSICQDAIENNWYVMLHHEFKGYDADEEILPLELSYKDNRGNKLMSVMYNISVSPNWVNECKNAIRQTKRRYIVSMGEYNGYLFPLKLVIKPYDENNKKYGYCPCVAVTEGIKPLVIKFDDFKIDNKYLAGKEIIASFEKYYSLKDQLLDSIKAYNLKIRQHPCFYEAYTSSKFLYGGKWGGSTQIDEKIIIDFAPGFSGKYRKYNMIDMSDALYNQLKEEYDDFINNIHIFYDGCMEEFNIIQEIKTLFPRAYQENMRLTAMLNSIESIYFPYSIGYTSAPTEDQLSDMRKLANSKNHALNDLYAKICNRIACYNSEYTKNQRYFTSPEDFVEAYYMSGNFKSILKERKKQMK